MTGEREPEDIKLATVVSIIVVLALAVVLIGVCLLAFWAPR